MRVLIVDDHPIVIAGCRASFASEKDIQFLEVSHPKDARALYQSLRPDVVVIDLDLAGCSGLSVMQDLLSCDPDARTIIFSDTARYVEAHQILASGAKGLLGKNEPAAHLVEAVRRVAAGGTYVSERIAEVIAKSAAGVGAADVITSREREVIRLLAHGKSMAEVASLTNVSYRTVASACNSLRSKLNARTPMELVRLSLLLGLL